ncbi:hypothetical protein HOY80DRAFT_1141112 [Tuber brumale]|nr:hypothetical protein HOY80DRAFT_1141112 [Tuber brumale]
MAEKIFYTILPAIKSGKPEVLEFDNLAPEVSTQVIESLFDYCNRHLEERSFRVHFPAPDHHLRVVIPSYLHEAAHSWLVMQFSEWRVAGLINVDAARTMTIPGSPRVSNFMGTYVNSVKEPDFAFVPLGHNMMRRDFPSVVMESGWTSSAAELTRDRRMWHEGSGGHVMVVILVKLYKPKTGNQVRVTLEISHTSPGAAVTITHMDVFPIPDPLPPDPTLTIEELFGGQCPPNHPPQTNLPLEIDWLRRAVEANLVSDGYQPA